LTEAPDPTTAPAEVVGEWATSLDVEPEHMAAGFDRAQQIVSEIGDTSDLDGTFEGLSDSAQWWIWRTLAQPEKRVQFLGQMDEETYEEIAYFVNHLPEHEERAVKRALGIAT